MASILNIGERLEAIVDLCPTANIIADIGCDHGYVTSELVLESKAKMVIATEKSEACILKAVSLADSINISPFISFRVGVGAFIHGYIPADFIAKYAGGDVWYAPIIAVLAGIPMYSNELGVLPIIEVLTQKGVLIGTAISFMMAVVALSLPEAMILKRILSIKLIAIFFSIVGFSILIVGYLLNYLVG